MTGTLVFDAKDFLVGITSSIECRDPGFGVCCVEDGSEPTPE